MKSGKEKGLSGERDHFLSLLGRPEKGTWIPEVLPRRGDNPGR